jgi:hypothetical protein
MLQSGHRYKLEGALKRLMRDKDLVFDCVRSAGIRLCDNAGVVTKGSRGVKKIRRCAHRHSKIVGKADYESLSTAKKSEHNMLLSVSY